MARDRKRRKRSTTPGNVGNPARSRARDMGLDDPTIDEAGLTDTTPAPDPLKNSSADLDQAKAAEFGAERPGPRGDEDEVEAGEDVLGNGAGLAPAPDEIQGDLVPASRVDPAIAAEREAVERPRKERGRALTFLRNSWEELRRVQWPDRRHTGQATAVTLGFVVVAGAFLGLMDAIWSPLIDAIL